MLQFEWDETKNSSNRKKHGVWFEEAQSVFDDTNGRLFIDPEQRGDEERFILIGFSAHAKLLVVIHCYRQSGSVVRIISVRKATKREERLYEKGI